MMGKCINRFLVLCGMVCFLLYLSGCHYSDGQWYIGESDVVPLPDFRGEVTKIHDCLVANEKFSTKDLHEKFNSEYLKITQKDNGRYWGHLVCYAFHEKATRKQIGKTVMFLTDQIEPGNRAHNDLEAMSILLRKHLDKLNDINVEKEKNMMMNLEYEKELLALRKNQRDLEDQVQKLKEIEILLEKQQ